MNTIGGAFGALLGNSTVEQIFVFNVAGQLIGAGLSPFTMRLQEEALRAAPNVLLSPQEAAVAAIRTAMTPEAAAEEARGAGINAERFATLLKITGNPPAPGALAVALRRGFIDEAAYLLGIAQGDLRNEYAELVKKLSTEQASPAEVLAAAVEGQLDAATARAKFEAVGGDPTDYDWRLGTVGSAPSPVELYAFAARGAIPWDGSGEQVVSFEQGIKEGHSRNKWLAVYRAALAPIPPPRTIVAMYHDGGFTHDQAAAELAKHGIAPELIAAYLKSGAAAKTAKAKELAESTVLQLYSEQVIDNGQASQMIQLLGYTPAESAYILEAHDLAVVAAAIRTAISRVHTLFVGHKIDSGVATGDLSALGMAADRITALLHVWSAERAANVRVLTESQVVSAWGHDIITTADASAQLVGLGYSAADADTLLAIHNKGPLTPAQVAGSASST